MKVNILQKKKEKKWYITNDSPDIFTAHKCPI